MNFLRPVDKSRRFVRLAWLRAALAALLLCALPPVAVADDAPSAATPPMSTTPGATAPSFWDPNRTPEKPDLSQLRQIRFLTEDDYPPFNFLLPDGQVAGFNIDLARAICVELDIACTIQRRRWDLLIPALNDNSGDAIIASLAINDETRKQVDFSGPYMMTPGRFAVQADTTLKSASPATFADRPIAVVAGSRHEAFLKAFYPHSTLMTFETPALARNALKTGRVQALFGDAISLSYWLNGAEAAGCCVFRDGPFTDPKYFGEGIGIAVKKGNAPLRRALDYALARLAQRGVFAELYLKYFPVGPF
ncbi:MAG: transporter substrate-binding domain-containing protein [Methylocystis sp.]|uniref:transporter substrate-binding domain-containing protein n=1 Tax=Methylocystis sp. TaxID=1911079 RepID=UPI00394EF250